MPPALEAQGLNHWITWEIKPRAGFNAPSSRQSSDGGATFWQEKRGVLGKGSVGTVITWKLGFWQCLTLL